MQGPHRRANVIKEVGGEALQTAQSRAAPLWCSHRFDNMNFLTQSFTHTHALQFVDRVMGSRTQYPVDASQYSNRSGCLEHSSRLSRPQSIELSVEQQLLPQAVPDLPQQQRLARHNHCRNDGEDSPGGLQKTAPLTTFNSLWTSHTLKSMPLERSCCVFPPLTSPTVSLRQSG